MKKLFLSLSVFIALCAPSLAKEHVHKYDLGPDNCYVLVTETDSSYNAETKRYSCAEWDEILRERARDERYKEIGRLFDHMLESGNWDFIYQVVLKPSEDRWYPDKKIKTLNQYTLNKKIDDLYQMLSYYDSVLDEDEDFFYFLLKELIRRGYGYGSFYEWTYKNEPDCFGGKHTIFIGKFTHGEKEHSVIFSPYHMYKYFIDTDLTSDTFCYDG